MSVWGRACQVGNWTQTADTYWILDVSILKVQNWEDYTITYSDIYYDVAKIEDGNRLTSPTISWRRPGLRYPFNMEENGFHRYAKIVQITFQPFAKPDLLSRTYCIKHKEHDKRNPVLLKERLSRTEKVCLCIGTHCF